MDIKSSPKPGMDAHGLSTSITNNPTTNARTAGGTVASTTGITSKNNNGSSPISMTFAGQSTPTVVTKPPIVTATPQISSVTRSSPGSVPSLNTGSINPSKSSVDSYEKSAPITPSCFATCPAQKTSAVSPSPTSGSAIPIPITLSTTSVGGQPGQGQGFGINPIEKPARAFGSPTSPLTGSASTNTSTTAAYGVRVSQAVPLSTLTSPLQQQKSSSSPLTESGQRSTPGKPLDSTSSDFGSKNPPLTSGSAKSSESGIQTHGNPSETENKNKKSISGGQPIKSGLKVLEHHPVETGAVGQSSASTGTSATLATGAGRKEPGQPQPPHNQLIGPSLQKGYNNKTNINQKASPTTSTVTDPSTSISSVNSPSTGTNPVFCTAPSDLKATTFVTKTTPASSQKSESIMDSHGNPLTEASVKSQAGEAKDGNINLMMNGNNKGSALMDMNKNINGTNNTEGKSIVNGNSGEGEVQKSVHAPILNDIFSASSSGNLFLSRAMTAPAQIETRESDSDDDMKIGDDVKMLMNLIEMAGLCAPERPDESQSAPSSRPGTAVISTSGQYTNRPGTAEKPIGEAVVDFKKGAYPSATVNAPNIVGIEVVDGMENGQPTPSTILPVSAGKDKRVANMKNGTPNRPNSASRGKKDASPSPGFRKELSKPKSATPSDINSPSGRPPTGTKARPSTGVSKSPWDKSAAGNAALAAVHSQSSLLRDSSRGKSFPNSTTSTFEPRSTKSSRMRNSLPRAASASMSTAQKTPDTSRSGIHHLDESRPRSAISISTSEHNNKASRPSSTLYQHTASSAQKGIRVTTPSPLTQNNLSTSSRASPSPSTPRTSRSTLPRTAQSKMGDSGAGDTKPVPATLKDQFALFSRFGDISSDGKQITLSNCDKWMKQAHVIDGKKITTTDTSICFKKLFKTAKKVSFEDFNKYIEDLAKNKKIEPQELLDKLQNSGAPSLSTATKAAHAGVVERLTDTSKYTGSHKERFDATGKGKGIEGRRDVADSSGYVNSFKNKLDLNKPDSKEASPAK